MKSKIRRLLHKRVSCIVHPYTKHTELLVTCIDACLSTPCSETNREKARERERGGREEERRESSAWSAECMDVLWRWFDFSEPNGKIVLYYGLPPFNEKQWKLYNYKCNRCAQNRYLENDTTSFVIL